MPFRAAPTAYRGSQARGLIGTTAAGLLHSHSNTRSLTHWGRPGIEPATSWFLVGFVSPEPQWELLLLLFCSLHTHVQHMAVPRLRVQMELPKPVYTTATAMQDLSHICNLYHSSQQHQFLNPLSKARDRTHTFMDTSWVHMAEPQRELPGFMPFQILSKF